MNDALRPREMNNAERATRRILVLLAHPSLDRSEVNRPMAEAARGIEGVTLVDLYAEYPDFQIDIDREQAARYGLTCTAFRQTLAATTLSPEKAIITAQLTIGKSIDFLSANF